MKMMDTRDTVARSGQNDGMQYNVGDFVLINPSKPSHIKIVRREKPLEPKRVPSDRTQHEPRTSVNTAGDSRPSQPLGPPLTGCQDNINHSQEAVKLLQERNRKSEAAAVASLPLLELPLVEVVGNDGLQHVGAGAEPHAGISQCSGFLQRRHRSLDFNVVDAEL